MKFFFGVLIYTLPLVLCSSNSVLAYDTKESNLKLSHEMPKELQNVGVVEKLGQQLSLDLLFQDESGSHVPLGNFFNQGRPVLFAMIYYSCPNLCNFQLNGVVDVLKKMKGRIGVDYDLVAVSMDHKENSTVAREKKQSYLKALGQVGAEKGWHFLVGSEENVKKLSDELGFGFKWNDELKQYAHAAVTYVVSPSGVISRYLYGIDFSAQTLRLSLVEASEGKIGNIIEQFVLFCFQFNPSKSRYVLYSFNLMRIGAVLTVLIMALILVPLWRKERARAL